MCIMEACFSCHEYFKVWGFESLLSLLCLETSNLYHKARLTTFGLWSLKDVGNLGGKTGLLKDDFDLRYVNCRIEHS